MVHSVSERESRVKTFNFDVCKKPLKFIGYHSPLDYHETYVSFVISIYTSTNAKRW